MVARQSTLSKPRFGNSVAKSDPGDGREYGWCANTVTCRVEERCYSTDGFGCLGSGGGCTGVVLCAATDCDVGELETGAYGWKA